MYPLSRLCVAIGGHANWNSSFAQAKAGSMNCFQLAAFCSRWTIPHRNEWQSPVGLIDFGENAPETVAVVWTSNANGLINFLKNSCRHRCRKRRIKLDVAAQTHTKRHW